MAERAARYWRAALHVLGHHAADSYRPHGECRNKIVHVLLLLTKKYCWFRIRIIYENPYIRRKYTFSAIGKGFCSRTFKAFGLENRICSENWRNYERRELW